MGQTHRRERTTLKRTLRAIARYCNGRRFPRGVTQLRAGLEEALTLLHDIKADAQLTLLPPTGTFNLQLKALEQQAARQIMEAEDKRFLEMIDAASLAISLHDRGLISTQTLLQQLGLDHGQTTPA